MALLDQHGKSMLPVSPASGFELNDPLISALWGRQMQRDTERGGLFDGPEIVDEYGRPITSAAPDARVGVFFGSVLDGCPLVKAEEQ